MNRICFAFTLALTGTTAHAASFDCARVESPIEQFICSDAQLSNLDNELTSAYTQALAVSSDVNALATDQKYWVRDVRNKCTDMGCMKPAYARRISTLSKLINPSLAATRSSVSQLFVDLHEACEQHYSMYPAGIICNDGRKYKRAFRVAYQYNGLVGLAVLDYVPEKKFPVTLHGDVIIPDESYATETGWVDMRKPPSPNLAGQTEGSSNQNADQGPTEVRHRKR